MTVRFSPRLDIQNRTWALDGLPGSATGRAHARPGVQLDEGATPLVLASRREVVVSLERFDPPLPIHVAVYAQRTPSRDLAAIAHRDGAWTWVDVVAVEDGEALLLDLVYGE